MKLAIDTWGTTSKVLKQVGYTASSKNNLLRRLADGQGSDTAAYGLLDALKKANVDTSKLPPMHAGDESEGDADAWRKEWAWIGEVLHEHARNIYDLRAQELGTFARALARQIGALTDLGRAT